MSEDYYPHPLKAHTLVEDLSIYDSVDRTFSVMECVMLPSVVTLPGKCSLLRVRICLNISVQSMELSPAVISDVFSKVNVILAFKYFILLLDLL